MWPQGGREHRFVVECKILHRSLERTISQGLEQTAAYLDRCGGSYRRLKPPTDRSRWTILGRIFIP